MRMPVSTCGSARSPACSRIVAGSSVAPSRGSTATSAAHVTTASARDAHVATRHVNSSATILPADVATTMATENAA